MNQFKIYTSMVKFSMFDLPDLSLRGGTIFLMLIHLVHMFSLQVQLDHCDDREFRMD
ncbi:transmembrane protein, putative [Medicago truncatula]|uniref:Transmembrane protein, putative n=1 Tax=Medicago truncatula TaxID=3880 RepID=G7LET2_MEDTR|nr:transmembrane protein, putative [Medicago truncatula]